MGLADGTLDDYRLRAAWLCGELGEWSDISSITFDVIRRIVIRERMTSGLRDVTLRKRIGFLRAVMQYAEACGATCKPIELRLLRLRDDSVRGSSFHTRTQFAAFRAGLAPGRFRTLADVFMWTGHHRADAYTMARWMIDPDRPFLDEQGEVWHVGGYWRRNAKNPHCQPCWLPLSDELRAGILEYYAGDGKDMRPHDLLSGAVWNLKKTFDAAADRAESPRISPTGLRRSFHSWMVVDDYPDEYRRIAMGHTGPVDTSGNAHRPTMRTKHYSPMTPGLMQLAIGKKR